ncbi:hypothetical protein GAV69_20355 [Salmonella enterica subsp. enterica serovar Eastbourne]|nr:hypothetical protein [Salmonella enterica subsp. enterica serovar Eastbourne]
MKNTQYKRYNKYNTIHSIHAVQLIHKVRTVHTPSLFFHSDPKKGSPGSSSSSPARRDPVTQDVASSSADKDATSCVTASLS